MTSTTGIDATFIDISTVFASVLPTVDPAWKASVLWMIIVGFIIAFILAFAVGANDVANSFGTTVGAKTLTLKQACILASVFETLGAILLGAKVGQTIRKGIIDVEDYNNMAGTLMAGEISAMLASGLWQLIATFLKLPVSGTHSIVGATIGFSLVAIGTKGLQWKTIVLVVISWFLSPVLAGVMAAALYFLLRLLIFQKDDPTVPGLIALPIMYGLTVAVNCFSVLFARAPLLGFDKLPYWSDVVIAIVVGLLVALLVQVVVVRKMKSSFRFIRNERKNAASQAPAIMAANFGGKKMDIMETITEKEPLDETLALDGEEEKEDIEDAKLLAPEENVSNEKCGKPRIQSVRANSHSPSTVEEAKQLRQRWAKRSRSTGQKLSASSSVRIPAVLQLEKNVMTTTLPVPSVQELKDEIRRNFSEPTMISLTQTQDADVYEVYINRSRRMVTIQRRNNSLGENQRKVSKAFETDNEYDSLLSTYYPADMKLEEPFDESDEEEGLVMSASAKNVDHTAPSLYSGAIEKGFRKLGSTCQNSVAIKIGNEDEKDENKKFTKDELMEAKEGRLEIRKMFSFLQILTACFGSFAHGGNDVSNAIGPLVAIWIIYSEGHVQQQSPTPLWILFYGGVGICVGLWVWGRRVIETMGNDLTNLTPSRGFTIELMSAITVLVASNVGLPVSTTHCKVGAVVAVGWVRARGAVDWKIFRNIVLAWFVTVPVSGAFSAGIFAIIRAVVDLT